VKLRSLTIVAVGIAGLLAMAIFADPYRRLAGKFAGDRFLDGKPSRWWESAMSSPDPIVQAAAVERLGNANSTDSSVPMLQQIGFHGTELDSRLIALTILSEQKELPDGYVPAFESLLEESDATIRGAAAKGLDKRGRCPTSAIPALLGMLADDATRIPAIRALAKTKSENERAVAPLAGLLQHPSTEVRWQAARTLGKLGKVSKSAIPRLVLQMGDPEWEVREHAAEACGDIGPDAAAAFPDLARLLNDTNHKVRRDAVRALGKIGPTAVPILGDIKKLESDPSEIVKEAAAKTVTILESYEEK